MSDKNLYCHEGMECHDGCRCAGSDGICHCPVISVEKCACDGYCGTKNK